MFGAAIQPASLGAGLVGVAQVPRLAGVDEVAATPAHCAARVDGALHLRSQALMLGAVAALRRRRLLTYRRWLAPPSRRHDVAFRRLAARTPRSARDRW